MNTAQIVSNGLQQLVNIGYIPEIKPGMVDSWAMMLGDLPPKILQSAFIEVARNFKPRFYQDKIFPQTIRASAMNMLTGEWAEAFEECVKAAARLDNPIMTTCPNTGALIASESFQFSSPLVRQAFKSFGGVEAFRSVKEDDRTIRAQFRDIYTKTHESAQGQMGAIEALAKHKNNVTQISSAKSHPLQIAQRGPDHPAQTETEKRIEEKARALRALTESFSSEEERQQARRIALAKFMKIGLSDLGSSAAESKEDSVLKMRQQREYMPIPKAARAFGMSVDAVSTYSKIVGVNTLFINLNDNVDQECIKLSDMKLIALEYQKTTRGAEHG